MNQSELAKTLEEKNTALRHQDAGLLVSLAKAKYGQGWDLLGPQLQRAVLAEEMVNLLMRERVSPGSKAEQFQLLFVQAFSQLSRVG